MGTYTVVVEWAHARPPTPENTSVSIVVIEADTDTQATLTAAQMVGHRPECVMPTRTTITNLVL